MDDSEAAVITHEQIGEIYFELQNDSLEARYENRKTLPSDGALVVVSV